MSKFDDIFNKYMKHAGDGLSSAAGTFDNLVGLVMMAFLFPFWCLGKLAGKR